MIDKKNIELDRLELIARANSHLKSLSNIAVLIGRSKQHFYTYKNRSGIGRDILSELEKKLSINPRYIQYGEEPMLLKSVEVEPEENVSKVELAQYVLVPSLESMTIEQIRNYYKRIKEDLPKIEKLLEAIDGM